MSPTSTGAVSDVNGVQHFMVRSSSSMRVGGWVVDAALFGFEAIVSVVVRDEGWRLRQVVRFVRFVKWRHVLGGWDETVDQCFSMELVLQHVMV